jgi:thiamine-phosphate pyrophosphorylase
MLNYRAKGCQLYLLSPPEFRLDDFRIKLSEAVATGKVSCFQLRLKNAIDVEIRTVSDALLPICHDQGVPFIINDRPDLAIEVGADGAHIGADDISYNEARRLIGNEGIVGVSCYNSTHIALGAAEAGADYVAFGAFFPTTTKTPRTRAEVELLTWWQQATTVPCVAIGGLTVNNCAPVIGAGADFIAVVSGVWDHPDGPSAALLQFDKLCSSLN